MTLPQGWSQLEWGGSWLTVVGQFDADGAKVEHALGRGAVATGELQGRMSVAPRHDVGLRAGLGWMSFGERRVSALGTQDVMATWGYSLLERPVPRLSSVRLEVAAAVPASATLWKSPAFELLPRTELAFGRWTGGIAVGLSAKQQLGPFAMAAGFRAESRVPAKMILFEDHPAAWVFPGAWLCAPVEFGLQIAPTWWTVDVDVEIRSGIFLRNLGGDWEKLDRSDGVSVTLGGGVLFNLARGVDLKAGVHSRVDGEDRALFPAESVHPSRGVEGTIRVVVRR